MRIETIEAIRPPTLREQRFEAVMAVFDAVTRIRSSARTATASELESMLSALEIADEMALDAGIYRAFDDVEPLVEATHEVVGNLLPLVDDLIRREALTPAPDGEQKEVSGANLRWMAEHMLADSALPVDKISRWLGFIQGVLAVRGLLSVKDERDATRSIFHRAYKAMGMAVPKSASMKTDGILGAIKRKLGRSSR